MCRVCDGLTDVAYFIFLLAVLLMILAVLFCLYYTREVPDLFGIRSESKWAFGLACLFGVPGLVLSNYDVGGFEAANPLNFTWVSTEPGLRAFRVRCGGLTRNE